MRRVVPIALVAVILFLATLSHGLERIVILPFESLSKDDISFIQEVVPKLLSSRLAEMTGLDTVTAEVASPDEALVTYGPSYLVSGSVTKLGSTYSLDIIVHDPSGEKVGGYFSSAQDENGILASLEGLAKDVAKALPGAEPAQVAEAELLDLPGETETPVQATGKEAPTALPAAEEPPAEKVAALRPGAVSEEKPAYTGIKKIRALGDLPGEIYRVAAADVDGDGYYEIAFMGRHKLYLYRFKEGEMYPALSFEKGTDHHFLHIDVFDVDRDGLMDFVVTDTASTFLNSFVVGRKGDRVRIKIDDISWYLSVFDDYRGKRRLIGQQAGNDLPYGERAFVVEWDGEKLRSGERVKVPRNEELVMGIIDMNAFSNGGKQRFILVDQYEKLRLADEEGRIFWKSGEYYSGAIDYIESAEIDPEMIEKLRFYVKGRMKRVVNDNKTAFLVREAPQPFLGIGRSFPWTRLVLLEWDGGDFVKKIEGEKSNKVITDFALLKEPGGGRTFIVTSTVISQLSLARKGKSKAVLFELVKGAEAN